MTQTQHKLLLNKWTMQRLSNKAARLHNIKGPISSCTNSSWAWCNAAALYIAVFIPALTLFHCPDDIQKTFPKQ